MHFAQLEYPSGIWIQSFYLGMVFSFGYGIVFSFRYSLFICVWSFYLGMVFSFGYGQRRLDMATRLHNNHMTWECSLA